MLCSSCAVLALALVSQTSAIRLIEKHEDAPAIEEDDVIDEEWSGGEHSEQDLVLAPHYRERAKEWMGKFLFDVLDGSAAQYDEVMGRCCQIANTTGYRPHETTGTASDEQIAWWNKNGCNKMVGANVLAVGTPLCDTWKFLKKGYVSERIPRLELAGKKYGGCSAEDRAIINASYLAGIPAQVKSLPQCQPSKLMSGGRVSVTRFNYCLGKMYPGVSPVCSSCYFDTIYKMFFTGDMGTRDPCMDMCGGMDQCWGMEKCVRIAGNCTRCFERHFLNHKFCTGGPVYQPVDGPTVLRKMFGFWTHLR